MTDADLDKLQVLMVEAPWPREPGHGEWYPPGSAETFDLDMATRAALPALLAEVRRLRETLSHSCTCSLADGAAPALRHEATCELRIAKTKRIDPALALSRFAAAMDSVDEVEELKPRLAAAIAARDEARCNAKILAHAYEHDSRPPARVVAQSSAYPARPEETL